MNRRAFLLTTAAACFKAPEALLAEPLDVQSRITALVLTGVSHHTSVKKLIGVFDILFEYGVPFTCLIDPIGEFEGTRFEESELAVLLSAYSLKGNLLEVASLCPDLLEKTEYFQSRTVREANVALKAALPVQRSLKATQSIFQTVACQSPQVSNKPLGVRSAGTRTVLVIPDEPSPLRSEHWNNGVIRFRGGHKVNVASYEAGSLVLNDSSTQSIVYLSLEDLASSNLDLIIRRVRALAYDLLESELTGKNSLQRVADFSFRDSYSFNRFIAIHLHYEARSNFEQEALVNEFNEELLEIGVKPSVGAMNTDSSGTQSEKYWVRTDLDFEESSRSSGPQLMVLARHDASYDHFWNARRSGSLKPGHACIFADLNVAVTGLDENSVLTLPVLTISEPLAATQLDKYIGHTKDIVISIKLRAIEDKFARVALKNQLLRLARDSVTRFVTVEELASAILPGGPELNHNRRTVASSVFAPNAPVLKHRLSKRELQEDARIAWSYFDKYTNRSTGLCPATVEFSNSGVTTHPTVTMWDVGSHINALVSASELGLVPDSQFKRNIGQILRQIRGRSSHGRLLPQGWLRVDRQKWGNRDFDGSDAGRLLAALYNLQRYANIGKLLEDLVASWSLPDVVIGGEVHSVIKGELLSAYRSHSAHYAARAFRSWGLSASSPYEARDGLSRQDGRMALLERVSWIGPIGAEPLLLEALELGMSEESAYLAKVLFAAQHEHFVETGKLVAVSEGPIDSAPWFTYQGLQMDASRKTWALDTVGHDDRFMTKSFWKQNLVLSSKAAFLWGAYMPHEYSFRLVDEIRSKCRTPRGFASSVFDIDGRVTENYTDINTNAVILQSVSKALSTGNAD